MRGTVEARLAGVSDFWRIGDQAQQRAVFIDQIADAFPRWFDLGLVQPGPAFARLGNACRQDLVDQAIQIIDP